MKLVFVSVYLNIHQLPLCIEFSKELGEEFCYISTAPLSIQRQRFGFDDMDRKYPFVVRTYESEAEKEKAYRIIKDADIAIMGSCPEDMLNARVSTGKVTYKYSERYFKGGNTIRDRIKYFYYSIRYILPLQNKNLYYLCASAYTANDVNKYCDFNDRTYKWGYFRENSILNVDEVLQKKRIASIVWVGRLIDWKHPETVVRIAEQLKERHIKAHIRMIGDGPMRDCIEELILEKRLCDYILLLGAQNPDTVKHEMENAQIAFLTSDFNEGWGMVVNEAMNACCAIVASKEMGAVPFLIDEAVNGFSFHFNDIKMAFNRICELINDKDLSDKLGRNAYYTMIDKWNAKIAADRFLHIANAALNGEKQCFFDDGPCSKAEVLTEDWYKE